MAHDASSTTPSGIYEVTDTATNKTMTLGADEIVEKYAKATETAKVNQWFWEFVDSETFQEWAGVKITVVEPSDAFEQIHADLKAAESSYRQTKRALQAALVQVLDNLVADDIKAGPIHKAVESKNAKAQYTIVEKYLLQAGPDLKTFIPKYEKRFPDYVVKELKRIQKDRSQTAANRLAGKKGK